MCAHALAGRRNGRRRIDDKAVLDCADRFPRRWCLALHDGLFGSRWPASIPAMPCWISMGKGLGEIRDFLIRESRRVLSIPI
ncbi:hypothetical protein [Paracoccus denitrificans]|jgi:hypothetical protein|uniref:Uncharacterized protein n=1 Tax=Paracoccus denitrificans (strain Pd 1222) TaxID=318586 RepID=A1AZL9_PARDP|nr:hypothetical protein [Paracoccus denitrificans]ABL68713.1 hypothetical protein Pden_0601 [Paracoccus denitrificans PD1222]MBB4625561.1 hypothetical protein [Paracoccus denitrificans]MCU7427270.1 hypothetical protein [Paracoccus denitrificans]UPV95720.1 hypothetical protein M0K93_03810 [Paracoccus denitrificans]